MAAASAVYETYELLENILLYLPVRDILIAERVSTISKSVIAQSKQISYALFRRRYPTSTDFGLSHDFYESCWTEDEEEWRPIFNPLMQRILANPSNWPSRCSIVHNRFVNPRDGSLPTVSFASFRKLMYDGASWKTMLMTQPPLHVIELNRQECTDCSCEGYGSCTCLPQEVFINCQSLGELWKGLIEHWHVCPDHPISNVPNCWRYYGDSDIQVADDDITGWEVLAYLRDEEAKWKKRILRQALEQATGPW